MPKRISSIDALRGLALILMCLHHLAIDLYIFGWLPADIVFSGWVYELHLIFASMFVVLAGVSSRFSRSNTKRGVRLLIVALLLSLATYVGERYLSIAGLFISFGILHMLGVCMVVYGLCRRWLDKLDWRVALPLYFAAFMALRFLTLDKVFVIPGGAVVKNIVSVLIMCDETFISADYFAIFPWIFMFLIGAQLGALIRDGKFPRKFYTINPPLLPAIGRKSLLIYLVHQPVLYGACWLIRKGLGG